jgi:ribosomal protein S30
MNRTIGMLTKAGIVKKMTDKIEKKMQQDLLHTIREIKKKKLK